MPGQNWYQKYLLKPITSNLTTDLMYFARSPFGAGDDGVMTYANFSAQFLKAVANSVTTTNITNANVTLAKLVNIAPAKLLGSTNVGAAAPGEVSIGAGLTLALGLLDLVHIPDLHILGNDSGITGVPGAISIGAGLSMSGTVLSATGAAATSTIVNDTTTNATMYPVWVTANTGSLPLKVSSTKLSFNPSTALLTLVGALSSVTGLTSSAGANLLSFSYTASAVNYINILNNATGGAPSINAVSTLDSNVSLQVGTTGLGAINLVGNGASIATFTPSAGTPVNYFNFLSTVAGVGVVMQTVGTDASIPLLMGLKNSQLILYDTTTTKSGQIRFNNAANTHYTELSVATAQATDLSLILPAVDGNLNYPLCTNGAGVLSFRQTPAFSAYNGTTTSLPAAAITKVLFDTEEFDIGSYFSGSTYTPLKAGIYQVNWFVSLTGANVVSTSRYVSILYKNGAQFRNGTEAQAIAATPYGSTGSALISMNGTTDTVEVYFYNQNAATAVTTGTGVATYFSAVWVSPLT